MSYCTIAEVRAEGYDDPPYSDARVQAALDAATRDIDRFLKRFFTPRKMTFRRTWSGGPLDLLLDQPIIRIDRVQMVYSDGTLGQELEPEDYVVFNRHVREGLDEPDDREDPKLTFVFLNPNLVYPLGYHANRAADLRRAFEQRVQNVELEGWFGYTDPDQSHGGLVTPDAGDAITATDTIKVGAGGLDQSYVGKTVTVSGSGAGNDGVRTVASVVGADTVKTVEQDLTTEGAGFGASFSTFPQFGITPGGIKEACLRMAVKGLPLLSEADAIEDAIADGRMKRMAVRDQSIEVFRDSRDTSGGGGAGFTGDSRVDSLLVQFMRPPKFGAA